MQRYATHTLSFLHEYGIVDEVMDSLKLIPKGCFMDSWIPVFMNVTTRTWQKQPLISYDWQQ
jgi:hypothetical protein